LVDDLLARRVEALPFGKGVSAIGGRAFVGNVVGAAASMRRRLKGELGPTLGSSLFRLSSSPLGAEAERMTNGPSKRANRDHQILGSSASRYLA
jgi:hypothetical protein